MRMCFCVCVMGMGLLFGAPAFSDTAHGGDTGAYIEGDTGDIDSGGNDSSTGDDSGNADDLPGVPSVVLSGETGGYGCGGSGSAWFLIPFLAWQGRRRR